MEKQTMAFSAGGLAEGTNAGTIKFAAAVAYMVDGVLTSKAITDNIAFGVVGDNLVVPVGYKRQKPEVEAAKVAKRRSTLLRAIPKWANLAAIEAIYREANRIEKLTGMEYHVDHIVPLQSRIVCGLHCESNLRVLPATSNISKSNRHWPDMP